MKHEFDVLLHAEDYDHAKSVATKDLKLEHVEKFAIERLADAVKGSGSIELVQPGSFDELAEYYARGGDGFEPLNCGIEARMAALAAMLRVMREPNLHYMVREFIRIARDLEMPVDDPFDC